MAPSLRSSDGGRSALFFVLGTAASRDSRYLGGGSLGPYLIGELLGAGGMGEVYRAHDTVLGRDVPIKILSAAFETVAPRAVRTGGAGPRVDRLGAFVLPR